MRLFSLYSFSQKLLESKYVKLRNGICCVCKMLNSFHDAVALMMQL